ncbi:MAG: hypothetical protein HYW79_02780 [Parcubacteria group bacterium]|nr:hypothetical protein [Parcubacteria group bacterium]
MRQHSFLILFLFFAAAILILPSFVFATDFSSDSFKVRDPVMNSGSYGTSESFKLFGSITEIAVGTSTSLSFGDNAGFLYFPFVTTPVISATAGNAQASLSWTSASAGLGWSVGSYSWGKSTTSGGPYSYTSASSNLSATASSLTNGTTYYFVVRVLDAFGTSIATSTQTSATPVAPPAEEEEEEPASSGGGGGGGGGGGIITSSFGNSTVIFSGRAYPKSTVTLLKDAQVAASTIAGPDSNFTITLNNLSAGNFIFSVYGEDKDGNRSSTFSFTVSVTASVTTNVGGIFIAPTISLDKSMVKRGDNLVVFGQSAPAADVLITINSDEEFYGKVKSDSGGVYLYNFDTTPLDFGSHNAKSKASLAGAISSFSQAIMFNVGTQNVAYPKITKKILKGDVNIDSKVNLIDFSIVAYWYNRANPPAKVDLNGDGKVNLIDFSIMAYYWTG